MTEGVTAADLNKKLASLIDLKAGVEDRIPISMQVPSEHTSFFFKTLSAYLLLLRHNGFRACLLLLLLYYFPA